MRFDVGDSLTWPRNSPDYKAQFGKRKCRSSKPAGKHDAYEHKGNGF